MQTVTIHESGHGGDKLRVDSLGNGSAYAIHFGEAGSPMLTLFFQGDDALYLREEFEALENIKPDMATRDVWIDVLDPYL